MADLPDGVWSDDEDDAVAERLERLAEERRAQNAREAPEIEARQRLMVDAVGQESVDRARESFQARLTAPWNPDPAIGETLKPE